MSLRYASLCSGIGGLDLAVENVFGYQLAWHSEYAADPASIHERHWPGVPNINDLTVADWSQQEPVELICAGYPCQPFSHAGARKGEDDERHLWPYINQAVRVLRPRWVVLENVAGHLSLGLGTVLGDLAEAGYDTEWCCVRASDVGAPHGRLRLFVVAADTGRRDAERRGIPGVLAGPGRAAQGKTQQRQRRRDAAGGRNQDFADSQDFGREGVRSARGRRPGPADSSIATADADRPGLEGRPALPGGTGERVAREDRLVDWGDYEPAIRRWEHFTRPVPRPTDDRGRLAPDFVEWMMGYPEEWTAGLRRPARLKALGNAVVPRQGAFALSILRDAWETHLSDRTVA